MGKVILQIVSAFAALVPYLLNWWEKRKAEKLQLDRETRRAAVNADPAGEFVRSFNPDADSTNPAHTANSDQSGPDTGGRNNNGQN